jgi:hypothetical protein
MKVSGLFYSFILLILLSFALQKSLNSTAVQEISQIAMLL